MNNAFRFGTLLLLTSALASGSARAQVAAPPPEEEEDVEIVAPGVGGFDAGEIVVRGTRIPNIVRTTPSVVSVLSSADIARTGEGDIAGALQRVTGLSLVGGKYVYVRGLGERYSSALLNGLPLPSPEPLKRVVPLDLFPTSVISSSLVQKSYSPNYPGEFGGGVINLTTRSIPTERFLEVGVKFGGNSVTTGQLGYTYFGSRTDFTGFDDGTRAVPSKIAAANASGRRLEVGQDFDLAYVQAATASLANSSTTVIQRNGSIPADMKFEFAAGNSWDVGDNRFGLVVSGGWDNNWRTRGGFQQVAGGVAILPDGTQGLAPDQDFRFLSTDNNILVNGLLGLSFEFGEHKIRATNFYVRDTLKEARMQRGIDEINVGNDDEVIRSFTSWFQRQLYTSQLVGEFKFGDLSITARGAYAESQRKSPYERSDSYRFDARVNDFVNDLTQNGNFARISFSDLRDQVIGANLDGGYKLSLGRPATVSVGYAFLDNVRASERRDYRYVRANGAALPLDVAQQRIDFLLSDFNVYTYGVVLREVSGAEGAAFYDSGLRVHAGYVQADAEVADGLTVTGGVRFESSRQFVRPQGVFVTDPPLLETEINENYFLPGGTITWNFASDMQVRLSGSKTIARPQFRELAPQPYLDIDSDRTAFGNQFLIDSQLLNAEGRYEWFFGEADRFAVGGFYKRINNPIETVAFESGGTFLVTFANAPKATLYGGEIELVKRIPLDSVTSLPFLQERRLLVNANYTYTRSQLIVNEGDTTINTAGQVLPASGLFIDGTPLTGQSEHVANLELGFNHPDRISEQTILFNYQSERVTQRGPTGTPDYRERPGFQLDFVWREEVNLGRYPVQLKFEARNLTNTDYREFQRLN
ncbi:MAG: TonB-dependent receptor, partial [Sphingomonadaceae bacterium]